ncbi:hypothetical protein AVEN_92601-1 [Araneus ventricosus]|uniref:Uncharacterized protein n=1 Tax=Araneus ventricosus TaxID=182803 RepID=A0A4Y2AJL8_ARAVE|nr:hypothetical protein AVEN_92601-1 [Araneus ventricosus]
MKDRPPQQIVRHCAPRIIASITISSCDDPPFYRGTTCLRRWALRATPPLLYPPDKLEPAYFIRQLLIRELAMGTEQDDTEENET